MKDCAKTFPTAPNLQMPDPFPALTFTAVNVAPVFWPSRSEDVIQKDSSPSARRSAGAGSIYAVDDDEGLIELYAILLEARGYLVRAFHDRAEALAALEKDRDGPELLIMDYLGHSMPVDRFMHRSLAAHPTLRILMASGLSSAHVRFSSARPDRFIQKPFTAEEFLKEVKAALVTR
jgi:CheY-like chemotaxis protein